MTNLPKISDYDTRITEFFKGKVINIYCNYIAYKEDHYCMISNEAGKKGTREFAGCIKNIIPINIKNEDIFSKDLDKNATYYITDSDFINIKEKKSLQMTRLHFTRNISFEDYCESKSEFAYDNILFAIEAIIDSNTGDVDFVKNVVDYINERCCVGPCTLSEYKIITDPATIAIEKLLYADRKRFIFVHKDKSTRLVDPTFIYEPASDYIAKISNGKYAEKDIKMFLYRRHNPSTLDEIKEIYHEYSTLAKDIYAKILKK